MKLTDFDSLIYEDREWVVYRSKVALFRLRPWPDPALEMFDGVQKSGWRNALPGLYLQGWDPERNLWERERNLWEPQPRLRYGTEYKWRPEFLEIPEDVIYEQLHIRYADSTEDSTSRGSIVATLDQLVKNLWACAFKDHYYHEIIIERTTGGYQGPLYDQWIRKLLAAMELYTRFYKSIPDEVASLIREIDYPQGPLLALVSRWRDGMDFVRRNLVLAACVAEAAFPEGRRTEHCYETLESLCGKNRKELLGFCGFPRNKSVLKTFSKVQMAPAITGTFCNRKESLKEVIADPVLGKLIRHLPVIHSSGIELLTARPAYEYDREIHRDLLSFRLLMDWQEYFQTPEGTLERMSYYSTLMRDVIMMLRTDGTPRGGRFGGVRQLNCLRDIEVCHDRLTGIEDGTYGETLGLAVRESFPPAPLDGTEDIVPITSGRELLEEGMRMQHCAGIYGKDVLGGKCYVYQVLKPERATLLIEWNDVTAQWKVGQLFLASNQSVAPETREVINKWLAGTKSETTHKEKRCGF